MTMTFKEIQELIKLINKSNLTEFKIKDGDFSLSIRTKKYGKNRMPQIVQSPQQIVPVSAPMAPMQMPMTAAAATPSASVDTSTDVGAASEDGNENEGNYVEVRSPIVGTFYRSSSPDKPQYVKPGDTIEVGSVVCIVEAMKLFNEIESEVSGKIVKVMLEDASPVQYDQVLFLVDPKG